MNFDKKENKIVESFTKKYINLIVDKDSIDKNSMWYSFYKDKSIAIKKNELSMWGSSSVIMDKLNESKLSENIKSYLNKYYKVLNIYQNSHKFQNNSKCTLRFKIKDNNLVLTSIHVGLYDKELADKGLVIKSGSTGSGTSKTLQNILTKAIQNRNNNNSKTIHNEEEISMSYDFELYIDKDLNITSINSTKIQKIQEFYKNFPNILESFKDGTFDDVILLMEAYTI